MPKDPFNEMFNLACAGMVQKSGLVVCRQVWDEEYGLCIVIWQDPVLMMYMGNEL